MAKRDFPINLNPTEAEKRDVVARLTNRKCPHCGRPAPVGCITCTRSECQEREYVANRERNERPSRRHAHRPTNRGRRG